MIDERWEHLVLIGAIKPPIVDGQANYHADTTVVRSFVSPGLYKREQSNPALFYVNSTYWYLETHSCSPSTGA